MPATRSGQSTDLGLALGTHGLLGSYSVADQQLLIKAVALALRFRVDAESSLLLADSDHSLGSF